MDEEKHTLIDIIIGIVICCILFIIPGLFWNGNRITFILGLIIGAVLAVLAAIHMLHSIARALDMGEKGATAYARKSSILRLLLIAVLLALSINFVGRYFALGLLLGFLCLKFSAYLQPLTHKYISNKFINKGR